MATRADIHDPGPFGTALKAARAGRRVSQLMLSLDAGVSARHLSFLESGRAMPSREMVLTLAEALALPLSARNHLLGAAGFASAYPASPLASEAIAPFRAILSQMMENHAPFPALLCDRHWNVLEASASAAAMLVRASLATSPSPLAAQPLAPDPSWYPAALASRAAP